MYGHHLLDHLRINGCGITGIRDGLVSKVESFPSLPSDAVKRLQELKPKSRDPKRPNIKFSL